MLGNRPTFEALLLAARMDNRRAASRRRCAEEDEEGDGDHVDDTALVPPKTTAGNADAADAHLRMETRATPKEGAARAAPHQAAARSICVTLIDVVLQAH